MRISDLSYREFSEKFEAFFSDIVVENRCILGESMRYASLDGGKRVRPLCVFLGARAADADIELYELFSCAAAFELVHSYSLVHDDMPEMDNDELRRGKPTVHKKFGAWAGLLTGDALLSLAMKTALNFDKCAAKELAEAAMDMAVGQAKEFEGCKTESDYLGMYALKTGALIRGAFRAGAILGNADKATLDAVTEFAENLGLAFQLSDDLLDDDKSIIEVIGREKTEKMLDEKSREAESAADKLRNAAELKEFAEKLHHRTR